MVMVCSAFYILHVERPNICLVFTSGSFVHFLLYRRNFSSPFHLLLLLLPLLPRPAPPAAAVHLPSYLLLLYMLWAHFCTCSTLQYIFAVQFIFLPYFSFCCTHAVRYFFPSVHVGTCCGSANSGGSFVHSHMYFCDDDHCTLLLVICSVHGTCTSFVHLLCIVGTLLYTFYLPTLPCHHVSFGENMCVANSMYFLDDMIVILYRYVHLGYLVHGTWYSPGDLL